MKKKVSKGDRFILHINEATTNEDIPYSLAKDIPYDKWGHLNNEIVIAQENKFVELEDDEFKTKLKRFPNTNAILVCFKHYTHWLEEIKINLIKCKCVISIYNGCTCSAFSNEQKEKGLIWNTWTRLWEK